MDMEGNNLIGVASAKGPINIALIKYWGKSDEEQILPINNSLSVTLDMDTMYSMTTISLYGKEGSSSKPEVKVSLSINDE